MKLAAGSTVVTVGNNSFWDLMSFDAAATALGCSKSDFAAGTDKSCNLSCLVTNGEVGAKTYPALHAEMDNSREYIRVRFGEVVDGRTRINWVLALNRA